MYYRLASAGGTFFKDLLNLLKKHLPKQPQASENRLALANSQAKKKP